MPGNTFRVGQRKRSTLCLSLHGRVGEPRGWPILWYNLPSGSLPLGGKQNGCCNGGKPDHASKFPFHTVLAQFFLFEELAGGFQMFL
ncbi:hypothetical protein [Paraburkholderia caribensis]|uniref:hypothetical protein n=1 Tax=Paraburkholderia caribensis TaxID=75105 RepID=UPI0034D379CF